MELVRVNYATVHSAAFASIQPVTSIGMLSTAFDFDMVVAFASIQPATSICTPSHSFVDNCPARCKGKGLQAREGGLLFLVPLVCVG